MQTNDATNINVLVTHSAAILLIYGYKKCDIEVYSTRTTVLKKGSRPAHSTLPTPERRGNFTTNHPTMDILGLGLIQINDWLLLLIILVTAVYK